MAHYYHTRAQFIGKRSGMALLTELFRALFDLPRICALLLSLGFLDHFLDHFFCIYDCKEGGHYAFWTFLVHLDPFMLSSTNFDLHRRHCKLILSAVL